MLAVLDGRAAAYMWVFRRTADDWPALGVAVSLNRAGEAAVAEAQILADAHGSAAYKREPAAGLSAARGPASLGRRRPLGAAMKQVGR